MNDHKDFLNKLLTWIMRLNGLKYINTELLYQLTVIILVRSHNSVRSHNACQEPVVIHWTEGGVGGRNSSMDSGQGRLYPSL